MKLISYMLAQKPMLLLLLIINFFGTVYGYYWYLPQLTNTPAKFLIFVPDSPTATLFFYSFSSDFYWEGMLRF